MLTQKQRLAVHVLTDGFACVGYMLATAAATLCWFAANNVPLVCDPLWMLPALNRLMPDHAEQCALASRQNLLWYGAGAGFVAVVAGVQLRRVWCMLCARC